MSSMILSAPEPANEAVKAMVDVLKLSETVEIVTDASICKLVIEEVHPLSEEQTKTTTIVGWPSCIKHLCHSTVLWDHENSLQVEDWIQAAATALLNGKAFMLVISHTCLRQESHECIDIFFNGKLQGHSCTLVY